MTFNKLKRLSLAFTHTDDHDAAASGANSSDESTASRPGSMPHEGTLLPLPRTLSTTSNTSTASNHGPLNRALTFVGTLGRTGSQSSEVSSSRGLRRAQSNRYMRSVSPETFYRRAEQKLTETEKQVRKATRAAPAPALQGDSSHPRLPPMPAASCALPSPSPPSSLLPPPSSFLPVAYCFVPGHHLAACPIASSIKAPFLFVTGRSRAVCAGPPA
jgi:hypothetical protein